MPHAQILWAEILQLFFERASLTWPWTAASLAPISITVRACVAGLAQA